MHVHHLFSEICTCIFRDDGRPLRCMHMHISLKRDDVHVHLPPKYSHIAVHMHKQCQGHGSDTIKLLDKS